MCHELLESTQKKEDAPFWGSWGTHPVSPITCTKYTKCMRTGRGVGSQKGAVRRHER